MVGITKKRGVNKMHFKTDDAEIGEKLLRIAHEMSKPFCYSCYKPAKGDRCSYCNSDDLMRLVDGVGVEYGLNWVVEHILESNLAEADESSLEENFEQYLLELYPETTRVGWLDVDTIQTLKDHPTDWRIALNGYESELLDNGALVEINGRSYWRHVLEDLL
jgi:hypothetical protein